MADYVSLRQNMVEKHLRARDITDEVLLRVMATIPREEFLSSASRFMAYNDFPLPIGKTQTMSQPYIVALMTQLLRLAGSEKVLEVGTGSGYHAAVLSRLCKKLVTIEKEKEFVVKAQENFLRQGYSNIKVVSGDGSQGYIYAAPYDAIIVTAACEKVPPPLLDQLKTGGRMVLPLGGRASQKLCLVTKRLVDNELVVKQKFFADCRFVPLKGKYGWS